MNIISAAVSQNYLSIDFNISTLNAPAYMLPGREGNQTQLEISKRKPTFKRNERIPDCTGRGIPHHSNYRSSQWPHFPCKHPRCSTSHSGCTIMHFRLLKLQCSFATRLGECSSSRTLKSILMSIKSLSVSADIYCIFTQDDSYVIFEYLASHIP